MQVRRVLVVFAVGVAVSGLFAWSAHAGDAPGGPAAPAAATVAVEVVTADGGKVVGRFAGKTLRIQADYGVV